MLDAIFNFLLDHPVATLVGCYLFCVSCYLLLFFGGGGSDEQQTHP